MKGGRVANLDPALLEYCYPQQAPVLQAAIDCGGSYTAAAKRLGMTSNAVECVIKRVRQRAAKAGHAPDHGMVYTAPEGFHVKGVTQWRKATEDAPAQWVKIDEDKKRALETLQTVVEDMAQPIRGLSKPVAKPRHSDSDLMAVYPVGDAHVGLYSWAAESGDDHDLETAEADLVTATGQLVAVAPPAKRAVLVSVGDFMHAENYTGETVKSRHRLDVDTRFPKVAVACTRILRRMIALMLRKHETVELDLLQGNHDPHATIMLRIAMQLLYEKERRVRVEMSPSPFHWHRHGLCLVGVNHNDMAKPADMPSIMAEDRAEDWGATKYRHCYGGHTHHDVVREYRGCTVETIRTLVAADAYTAGHGYRSGRDMKCDVWHAEYGRILRHTIGIRQVRRLQKKAA